MMERKEIVVIRVLTTGDRELLEAHSRLLESWYPTLHTSTFCIPDQPRGICSPETSTQAIPKIISLAKEHQDAAAIVVSCCDDPGVRELRQQIKTPIIGAGSAVCALALSLGTRTGIIGITDYAPRPYREMLGEQMINLGSPENVSCTLDLLTVAGRQGVISQALELKRRGADVIALACTGMGTIGIASELEEACGLPVIDPVMAEGLFAYYACLRGRPFRGRRASPADI